MSMTTNPFHSLDAAILSVVRSGQTDGEKIKAAGAVIFVAKQKIAREPELGEAGALIESRMAALREQGALAFDAEAGWSAA